MKRALLLIPAAIMAVLALAPAAWAEDYMWMDNGDGTCTITYYTGPGGDVVIPDTLAGLTVTVIGEKAFFWYFSLTSITIPDSVVIIEYGAFAECFNMTIAMIGNGATTIDGDPFFNCNNLMEINVDAANPAYSSITGVLFNKSQTELLLYPKGKAGSYIVPDSVISIGDSAFACCYYLTDITIPDSVAFIDRYAFGSCGRLAGVYFKGNAPVLGENVFSYVNSAIVYYIPGTSGWGPIYGGRPTAVWPPLAVDVDENYSVDLADFVVLAGQWLETGCGEANGWCGGADFDRSGGVDAADLLLLADDWLWP